MSQYVKRALSTLIRRIPMLRFASDADFTRLLERAELKSFKVGEMIFEEGDSSDAVFVVNEGFVKIAKEQKLILATSRRLADAGTLMLGGQGNDFV